MIGWLEELSWGESQGNSSFKKTEKKEEDTTIMKTVFKSKSENLKLESYFNPFRKYIVGVDQYFESPFGKQKIVYADWTASGRLYFPIEDAMTNKVGQFVANTHTETSFTGALMTEAYYQARQIIKKHVNANSDDVLIIVGTGMTGAINKLQRILGLKVNEHLKNYTHIPNDQKPVVFISHMEHHSNHTSWMETICKVVIIPPDEEGLISIEALDRLLKYHNKRQCIVAVTACSNVTGIKTPVHEIALVAHHHGAMCIVDYACSAPYVDINMHQNSLEYLDAIVFSPHKFLGGPGTSGVLIFNKKLYQNLVPDQPGGGTVTYTNPWGDRDYYVDIETREDGGTPGFLQTMRTAMAIKLKEQMGVENILNREKVINDIVFQKLSNIKNLHILASHHEERLGIFSFYIDDVHYNLVVKLLNDKFGIQTRGGCSCAGTYGHYLLNVDKDTSKSIEQKILEGCLVERPGWVRMSIHPTMTNEEIEFICNAIEQVANKFTNWRKDYTYDSVKNEFIHKKVKSKVVEIAQSWFS